MSTENGPPISAYPNIIIPVLSVLHAEGGLEAVWNAAVEACMEIAGHSAFWDDGRDADFNMEALLVVPVEREP